VGGLSRGIGSVGLVDWPALELGLRGGEVRALQVMLVADGRDVRADAWAGVKMVAKLRPGRWMGSGEERSGVLQRPEGVRQRETKIIKNNLFYNKYFSRQTVLSFVFYCLGVPYLHYI
jgi:hypothetical protein